MTHSTVSKDMGVQFEACRAHSIVAKDMGVLQSTVSKDKYRSPHY